MGPYSVSGGKIWVHIAQVEVNNASLLREGACAVADLISTKFKNEMG